MATDKETWILYQTTNTINGKIYVGVHKLADTSKSKKYLGSGKTLKKAIDKYGRENFTRVTLAKFPCSEDAYFAEAEMVTEEFAKRPDTYNMKSGGRGGIGFIHTPEARAKISVRQTGRTPTEETKAKLSAALKGRYHTEEAKAKMSAAQKGKKLSEETKAKIGAASKGRPCSEEVKIKNRAFSKQRVYSAETRAKLSAAAKGNSNWRGAKYYITSKAVVVDGRYYESITKAFKAEKMASETIHARVKSIDPKWQAWFYVTEEGEKEKFRLKNNSLVDSPNT